ncbi:MAG: hypothetical protein ACD_36C00073G0001 [uncultured bacterium]|uniref:Secreted protein n=1 Tax=Candidatus Gottesmanbacteria bacterium RIFCSPLOWO2_01_FULL_43_11b TaxID=1798392 RepID=A0A1F6AFX1_9BACT|nr:MAG: hypothetical protein ACD_36C00073G0001 [uncultured bacterium]OGG23650.1 MAG: hypothetical protein A3A79_00380 [Candidatus Gottesmanbacteria bacterium RIFCSPLOWO2_01_FULL_43_11b]
MQKQLVKFGATVASLSLVATIVSPVALAADLEIMDNGAGSTNTIVASETNTDVVGQSNESLILIGAFSSAKTGGNQANNNTNSVVTNTSGDATATTSVVVTGSSNTATLSSPCGCGDPPTTEISGNGKDSTNTVVAPLVNTKVRGQSNGQLVGVLAVSRARSRRNRANGNTGSVVTNTSGNATDTTGVTVTGSTNTLTE